MQKSCFIGALLIVFWLGCGNEALIEITKPGDGALVNGFVEIIAEPVSSFALDSIRFYIDDELFVTSLTPSNTCIWDANSLLHGSIHNISGVAFFANGLVTESDIVSVSIYSHRTVLAELFGEYF